MMLIRAPAVAGEFYSLEKEMLKKEIESSFNHTLGPKSFKSRKIIAAVVPHAGYIYSGPVAAWVYSIIENTNYLILGTNHSGMGSDFAISKNGLWKTPLGEVIINESFAERLMKENKLIEYDILPHEHEHSIEVQLPFLQQRFDGNFKFVPLLVKNEFADESLLDSCKVVGKSIGKVIKSSKEKWIVLASSDFSHYIPNEVAKETDKNVIKAILKLDGKDFFARINAKNASLCGFGAIATAMFAAKELGAKKADLLKYATSGDVTGETASVVGYASIIMY